MSKTYCYHLESSSPNTLLEYLGVDEDGMAIVKDANGKTFATAPSNLVPEEGKEPLHANRVK